MPYICPEHKIAYERKSQLTGHFNMSHKGQEMPDLEGLTVEEVPEGYTYRAYPAKPPEPPEPPEKTGESRRDRPSSFSVEALATTPVDRFYELLRVKGIDESQARKIQQEFRLSPWAWGDAQEIARLIRSNLSRVSADWISTFLKQYATGVELREGAETFAFVSGPGGRRADFFTFGQSQAGETELGQYIRYLMMRDERRDRERELERERGKSPEVEGLEKKFDELANIVGGFTDTLTKREEEREQREREERQENRVQALENAVREVVQKPPASEGQNQWLQAYLNERDKREEERLVHLTGRLEAAQTAAKTAQEKAERARTEAQADEEAGRARHKKEMEEMGYARTGRTTEDRVMDLAEQAVPLIHQEAKGLREDVKEIVRGAVGAAPTSNRPLTPEEAERVGNVMELEEQLRKE